MNSDFIELSRISKIYSNSKNKKYLLEFSFGKKIEMVLSKNKVLINILKSVFGKQSKFKISKLIYSRKTFKPSNKVLSQAEKLIRRNFKKTNIKLLGKIIFLPSNMSKAWNYSDLNVKKLNELSR